MAKKQHLVLGQPAVPQELLLIPLSIPPEAAVEPTHPKLFQSCTHPLDSLPLDDQAVGQALKLNIVGCQIADPLHFETHLIFVPGGSPQHGFFWLNWALNSFCSTTASPTSLVRSRMACSTEEINCGGCGG